MKPKSTYHVEVHLYRIDTYKNGVDDREQVYEVSEWFADYEDASRAFAEACLTLQENTQ